jgi:hypothetical protein
MHQQEVRWHVAQLLPRLALTASRRARAITILRGFVDDDSRIVWTFAMQALADLAEHDEQLRPQAPRPPGAARPQPAAGWRNRGWHDPSW